MSAAASVLSYWLTFLFGVMVGIGIAALLKCGKRGE